MTHDIEQLIHDVLHGQATDADAQRLSDWIVASKENAIAYYRVLSDERAIHRCLEHDAMRAVSELSDEPGSEDAGLVLSELAEAEANAKASLVELVQIKDRRWLTGSLKYAWAAVIGIAALTAVVVTLLVGSHGTPPTGPVVERPGDTVPALPVDRPSVATLTAEYDAQWAYGKGASPGSALRVGQQLTLTQGFAEITTHDGAIAILEAPATIELIDNDNDNALRLHTGKLVGICHTEASKGFVVKTDHADIIDLGTEFGVEARANRVIATVFTGEVTLTTPGGEPQAVTANQTARVNVNGNNRRLVVQDQPAKGFDKLHAVAITKTTTLPGTGQATAVGKTDPHWYIIAIDGLASLKPVAATVADPASFTTTNRENMRFMPNTPASRWVTPLPHYETEQSVTYQTTFDVSGFDLKTLALDLKFLADKQVAEITLNGRPVDVPAHGSGPSFVEMTALTLREGFIDGKNTLSFKVQRYRNAEGSGFWTGLRAELELTGRRLWAGPSE